MGKSDRCDLVRFSQDEMTCVACGRWIAKDMELAVFEIQYPVVRDA